jgi:hypothetical protein
VIWLENDDPKTSALYPLSDIDVKSMKIRIMIAAAGGSMDGCAWSA